MVKSLMVKNKGRSYLKFYGIFDFSGFDANFGLRSQVQTFENRQIQLSHLLHPAGILRHHFHSVRNVPVLLLVLLPLLVLVLLLLPLLVLVLVLVLTLNGTSNTAYSE